MQKLTVILISAIQCKILCLQILVFKAIYFLKSYPPSSISIIFDRHQELSRENIINEKKAHT